MADIEGPFAGFAEALRHGSFDIAVDPAAWPAELISAHLILSNDLLTEVAQAVLADEEPTYDNQPADDGDALREVLIRTGSLRELANEVERSASDLQAAYDMLQPEQRRTPVATRIIHEGELFADGLRPLGELVEDNARIHLETHLTQLLELRD